IDKLTLSFEGGLNVLTGETGAGKSILLDALSLALGARSDAGLIRAGANQASVTAIFSNALHGDLNVLLEEQGLAAEDPLILRRVICKDGKSRAFLCDQPIGVSLLKQIGECLLEVHGQFETHGLLNASNHRTILDLYAGAGALKKQTAKAFADWHGARAAYDEALALHERTQNEEEFLKAAVAELDDLAPQDKETELLAAQRTQLQHREKILDAIQTTEQALGSYRGAASQLALAGKTLARIADKAPALSEILTVVDRALNETHEATAQLARFGSSIDNDGASLDKIEERLFKLRAVARKHGHNTDDLIAVHEDLRARLALLTDQSGQLSALSKAVSIARATYVKRAEELSEKRQKAAEKLAKDIMRELPPLKLERAVFEPTVTRLEENAWNGDGMDRIAFMATTNVGHALAPLAKVASGGELSRFMLAIKVVLSKADPVPTLIFDEVDAGIGGATASAVGQRLAKLGRDVQVLVVTHSPQVAALGGHHLRVSKSTKAQTTTTNVEPLSRDERIEEIARMLAGTATTDAARDAARALMGDHAPAPKKKARA
ncbi:MAG TPA: DNA repair protein RecN, partial [Rhodospirillaceae bacterium]|nr:DNA repair protein RecN [Rhodospirillaceae bacterium]